MRATSAAEYADRSVPLGRYWRSRPSVFSLDPRCQGECGSQKWTGMPPGPPAAAAPAPEPTRPASAAAGPAPPPPATLWSRTADLLPTSPAGTTLAPAAAT